MKTPTLITRKRLLPVLVAVPIACVVVLGAAGIAQAATNGSSDKTSYQSSHTTTAIETDVIVDAGNAEVLAKQVDQEKDGSENKTGTGSSDTSTSGTRGQTSQGSTSGTTGP